MYDVTTLGSLDLELHPNPETGCAIATYCYICRIVDNMPIAWCYETMEDKQFCTPGFPFGCFVDEQGQPKDACTISVS